ncbi:polymorphic toxin-type HINT domain-containing protein, partial [Streptomyces sp. TRM64462]|uniref:polymorphic toxin-type HINT domain-containing protein n=1 Tax=Streptomyces sp. TRM64462 TaxID=2741726 RepID=UPI0020C758B9
SGNTTQRVLNGDTQALNWDRRNKLTSVDANNDGTPDVKYLYDAGGNRLLEDDGTTRTLYLGEAEIVVNTSGQALDARRYYTHPGAPTTVRSTGGKTTDHKITVLQADHHNTATNAIEQTAGQAIIRRKFDPYGTPRGTEPANWADRRTFLGTGIDDPATGLTHIGAREYDASTGRFISADPIIDLTDPLQMNGYTYANGNPLTYSDPTGLRPITDCERGCQIGNTYVKDHMTMGPNGQWIYNSTETTVTTNNSGNSKTTVVVNRRYGAGSETARVSVTQERRNCSQKEGICGGWKHVPTKEVNLEQVHLTLDLAGFVPVLGSPADFLNAFLYTTEGNWSEAGWSLVAIVPWIGEITAVKRKGGKVLDWISSKKAPDCPVGHSFVAGTKVLLADGTAKPIEELKTGDQVLATDPETGETEAKTVTATIVTEDDKTYVDVAVTTEDGAKIIVTTDHHPFWSESEQAWLDAGDIKPGMALRAEDGSPVSVTATRTYGAERITYNLTVADLHTYYVLAGETPVLVHNCDWTVPSVRDLDATWARMGFASRSEFGEVAWGGRSLADASKLKTPEQVARMRGIGMTVEDAKFWRNFYQDIHKKSAAKFPNNPEKVNPSARSRADLFQYYMDSLGG